MAHSVLILKSSPRVRSNSNFLADQVKQGAQQSGSEVREIALNRLNIHPCCACDLCRRLKGECAVNDDMQQVYPQLLAAGAILMASPVYWFTFSAQLKLCLDRIYALTHMDGTRLRGKRLGVVLTYGDEDLTASGVINAIHTLEDAARYLGWQVVGCVHGSANKQGEILQQPEVLERAYQLGIDLSIGEKSGANSAL